jgi:uncharacterized membrane protein
VTIILAVSAFVLALFAWRRANHAAASLPLRERMQKLEGSVEQLRLELRDLRSQAGAAEREAALTDAERPAPPAMAELAPDVAREAVQKAAPVASASAPPPAESASAPAAREMPAPPIIRTPPPTPPPPPTPRAPAIDLEQFLGVRGAAVAGGVVLFLAAIYFLRYSIEAGLLPPPVRIVLSALAGVGCVTTSELGRVRARYARTAEALAGSGIVILYATFWAARSLYALIPIGLAFAGMIGVTVACAVLAYRRSALVIAALGLAGGFATPLLLSSGQDRPLGLFGYLLLLDLALLALARRRQWPGLAIAALVGTAAYQAFWLTQRLDPQRLAIGLGVLGAFAALFASAALRMREQAPPALRVTQAAGALFPFAMALYLASRGELTPQLWPLALLLLPLVGASAWLARARAEAWLATSGAAAAVAVLVVWAATQTLDAPRAWQLALTATALAAILHAFVERDRAATLLGSPGLAAAIAAFGGIAILLPLGFGAAEGVFAPLLLGALALGALALRHGTLAGRGPLQVGAALPIALALAAHIANRAHGLPLSLEALLALALGLALAMQVFAGARRGRAEHAHSEHAAALLALAPLLALLALDLGELSEWLWLGASLAFGALPLLSATRLVQGGWMLAALAATALVQTDWALNVEPMRAAASFYATALLAQLASIALFAFWPFAAGRRLVRERVATWASALAPLLWFPSVLTLFRAFAGRDADGLPAIAFAGFGLAAARLAQLRLPAADAARRRQLVWQLAVALAFGAAAVPLQLAKQWITLAWALEALALIWLWRRYDHPGLKWTAALLFAAVTVRLLFNPALLGYYGAARLPFLNWLLYTYLVPAAALVAAARWLAPLEVPRLRGAERSLYTERAVLAASFGIAALALAFAWLNLAIVDAFAEGSALTLDLARKPARDLSISLAWGAYALGLLALGVRRASRGLRWASLALMMVTIAKVFLYDLGELEDLYRVASLLGLAFSLIAVSLAYQRFVFRSDARREE